MNYTSAIQPAIISAPRQLTALEQEAADVRRLETKAHQARLAADRAEALAKSRRARLERTEALKALRTANSFAGDCHRCGTRVESKQGQIVQTDITARLAGTVQSPTTGARVSHLDGQCPTD